ncbi:MAG: hypothetical protein ACI4S1_15770, partial [Roseburia sp.]
PSGLPGIALQRQARVAPSTSKAASSATLEAPLLVRGLAPYDKKQKYPDENKFSTGYFCFLSHCL